ncbi:MAG: AbrB/MazE/SpoVT family DNA-binding domain-containing protein [bacterium]
MARRKIDERNIRSLTKMSGGTSYGITIPMEFIRKLGWRSKQKLEVRMYSDRIVVRDWEG